MDRERGEREREREILLVLGPSSVVPAPGTTQYLLSLSRVALSASVEHPELWDDQNAPQLLQHLLSSPCYEVRALALDTLLKRLQQEGTDRGAQGLDQTTLSHLTGRLLHETHPHCLSKEHTLLSSKTKAIATVVKTLCERTQIKSKVKEKQFLLGVEESNI
ncbi:hypothetical protein WMY93_018018 [Mugilogobius chulae]|uniref:Uncharacterized protein n=1 Tax=Mugilogobius chulae TaxID=88201 RepID=A0AAW0NLW8_9GOBI